MVAEIRESGGRDQGEWWQRSGRVVVVEIRESGGGRDQGEWWRRLGKVVAEIRERWQQWWRRLGRVMVAEIRESGGSSGNRDQGEW